APQLNERALDDLEAALRLCVGITGRVGAAIVGDRSGAAHEDVGPDRDRAAVAHFWLVRGAREDPVHAREHAIDRSHRGAGRARQLAPGATLFGSGGAMKTIAIWITLLSTSALAQAQAPDVEAQADTLTTQV